MRNTFIFTLLFISSFAFAQKKNDPTFLVAKEFIVTKFHTVDELKKMDKFALLELYKERVTAIINFLPFIALTNKPGQSLKELGIPESNENLNLLKNQASVKVEVIKITDNLLSSYMPYADRNETIWSIVFFEDILKKIAMGHDF
ncbi:MAG: hypothetical protein SNJ77_02530 [Cytophagales bacterium]